MLGRLEIPDELGVNWKPLEGPSRATWGHLRSLGGQLEVTWRLLGATWGSLEGHFGTLVFILVSLLGA